MKLTTRSRYGTRFMYELALHHTEEFLFLKDIAQRQSISEKYLSKLVIPLKAAGLVLSARGAQGGYRLSREPKAINLRQIIEALEGSVSLVDCVGCELVCDRIAYCPTRDAWKTLSEALIGSMEGITLEDLVTNHHSKAPDYVI